MNMALKEISTRFYQSSLGRRLGKHSEAAQTLAFYLLGNPYWDTSGSYRLSMEDMAAQTGLSLSEIPSCLLLLQSLGFCTYDCASKQVFVPLLAEMYQQLLPKKYHTDFSELCE